MAAAISLAAVFRKEAKRMDRPISSHCRLQALKNLK
jgi:hypothetical protein